MDLVQLDKKISNPKRIFLNMANVLSCRVNLGLTQQMFISVCVHII